MNDALFAAARRTDRMIGRGDELNILEEAICFPGLDTRLVILKGKGGVGKTRLLLELLRLTGHPDERDPGQIAATLWRMPEPIIISKLLDFAEVELHTFQYFMQALRQAFVGYEQADFSKYDAAREYHQRKIDEEADYRIIHKAAEAAEYSFFEDYQAIAKQYRLVWVLDTAEQLTFTDRPEWLFEEKILTPEDLSFNTPKRLLELLEAEALPNTTIILAGRPELEAEAYFEFLKDPTRRANGRYNIDESLLDNFTRDETRDYLQELATNSPQQLSPRIAEYLSDIANQSKGDIDDSAGDRVDVLWLYTGGQPVRLALYVDVLAEGKEEPEALQDTFAQAKTRVGWDEATNQPDPNKLNQVRFNIEDEFINLLFSRGGDLRSQILRVLVQARRPLDADQLHFILDSPDGTDVKNWQPNKTQLAIIETELQSMQMLSFTKKTLNGQLTLQDEMYRIYDTHAVADQTFLKDEITSRRQLYRRLLDFTRYHLNELNRQKILYREQDEQKVRWETPGRALSMRLNPLNDAERRKRGDLNKQIRQAQLETLHYLLKLNPDEALNDTYYDLAEERSQARDLETDAQIQIEVERVLYDELTHRFIHLTPREDVTSQEQLWQALQRSYEQDVIVRWIKRFAFSNRHDRALDFAERVEAVILDKFPRKERHTRGWTLGHTFAKSERTCWREYARIHLGQDQARAIESLNDAIKHMELLLTPPGIPERGEQEFLGHPAEIRLKRVIGTTYNNLGLGYTYQGQFRLAAKAYSRALAYFRETKFVIQKAITLNNLSRVLSEMGRTTRSVRICRDGLELKQTRGFAENQIAYSYNTLALIHNNNLNPHEAWPEATKAVVYFRRLEDYRGLGLALLQLGEALRRLAFSKQILLDSREDLLNEAETATREALDIFTNQSPINKQIMRRIEAQIEAASLYRDYMRYFKNQPGSPQATWEIRAADYRDQAIDLLKIAIDFAKEWNYPEQKLDAQVNLVWTYYYAGDSQQAEQICAAILKELANKDFVLKQGQKPPIPESIHETYAFFQLGKLFTAKGRIALDEFCKRAAVIEAEHENKSSQERFEFVEKDKKAIQHLQTAAEAFVLTLAYAELFSARSPGVSIAFDHLYDYLKKFNVQELQAFHKYQWEARETYQVTEIEPEQLANVDMFMRQSFGDILFSELAQENQI